ncbi:nuclear transport factor 2 family protein [Nocardia arizonensis]|uniref:nuclear transport factor 2 family protein n=1 Tax=Nocardia arizonensis TaxID=1141647 RepID=UPI0006D21E67|nr:nuclear transport factor 2 family protein [Nocardia arizonensis]
MTAHLDLAELIIGMHWELAEWMGSNAPPKVFDRFSTLFHDEFTAVTMAGQIVDRDTLLAGVWAVRNKVPGLEIEVYDVEALIADGDLTVVRFRAENRLGAVRQPRLATATVLATENGYLLRTLHETAAAPPGAQNPTIELIREGSATLGE